MSITISSKLLSIARQLYTAETIGDVFAVSLPYSVARLERPGRFSNFFDYGGPVKLLASIRSGLFLPSNSSEFSPDQVIAANETVDIAADFGAAVVKELKPDCQGWNGQLEVRMTGRKSHGNSVHFDHPEALPNDIVGLVVSSNPSLTVPHDDALDIIQRSSFSRILDVRLSDPNLRQMLSIFYTYVRDENNPINGQLREALFPTPINTFNINAGITPHMQPHPVANRRVCAKTVMHFDRM